MSYIVQTIKSLVVESNQKSHVAKGDQDSI